MNEITEEIRSGLRRGECIALDAEFTNRNEMLELAVVDIHFNEIFSSLFRPRASRRWSLEPHGISPEMVTKCPRFAWRVPRVQRVVDRARFLIGFALENDISHLRSEGIARLETKRVLDLRDWFWLIHGRHHGYDYREGVSLAVIIERILSPAQLAALAEEHAGAPHRAGYDTLTTLHCFLTLMEQFVSNEKLESPVSFSDVLARFDMRYAAAMEQYRREAAAGFISVVLTEEGQYIVKSNKERPAEALKTIAVANRDEAMATIAEAISGRHVGAGHRGSRIFLKSYGPAEEAVLDNYAG